MSRLGGGRSITDRVVFRQDEPPAVTDSVVWIDTSGEQPQAKIYDSVGVEWLSVGVVDYNNLLNTPNETTTVGEEGEGYETVHTGTMPHNGTVVSWDGKFCDGFRATLSVTGDYVGSYEFTIAGVTEEGNMDEGDSDITISHNVSEQVISEAYITSLNGAIDIHLEVHTIGIAPHAHGI